jgi:hypothetical protein
METMVSFIFNDPFVTAAAFSTRDIVLSLFGVQAWRWKQALLNLASVMKSFVFVVKFPIVQ